MAIRISWRDTHTPNRWRCDKFFNAVEKIFFMDIFVGINFVGAGRAGNATKLNP